MFAYEIEGGCDRTVQEGVDLKDKGNEKFKAGEYAEAAVFYRKGLYYASFDDSQVRCFLLAFWGYNPGRTQRPRVSLEGRCKSRTEPLPSEEGTA